MKSRYVERPHRKITRKVISAIADATQEIRFKTSIDDATVYVVMVGERAVMAGKVFDEHIFPLEAEALAKDLIPDEVILLAFDDEREASIAVFGTNHFGGSFWLVGYESASDED